MSSANWFAFFFRKSSRISCKSRCARVPLASACETLPLSICSAAFCAASRVWSSFCFVSAMRCWFSGFSARCFNSSRSASICFCSSCKRFKRRRISSFSCSFFASCNAV